MKHILLYGESGAGKTTLLHRLARESGRKAFGYHSLKESADENGIAKVFLHEQGKEYHCLEDNLVGIVGKSVFKAYPKVFDAFSERLLSFPMDGIILLDEIGILEQDAFRFQKAIFTLLDGQTPVIAAVKQKEHPYLRTVLSHPNCVAYHVTPSNREDLFEKLCSSHFSKELQIF